MLIMASTKISFSHDACSVFLNALYCLLLGLIRIIVKIIAIGDPAYDNWEHCEYFYHYIHTACLIHL